MYLIKWLFLLCLLMTGSAASAATACTPTPPPLRYATSHFEISYAVTGSDAVSSNDTGQTATLMDGTALSVVPGNDGFPDYVELIGVYLEHAWDIFQQAGFRLPEGEIPVSLLNNFGAYGLYLPGCGEIYLETDLVSPGTTAAHELFHAVQYQYWTSGDFAALPATEQAFYKEATAEWAMIEVMKPMPYVSWFADPDRVGLFNAGSSAAFFWIYYLEQLSAWAPGDALSPGFDAMKDWLERVGSEAYDLRGALNAGPEEIGQTFAELLEQFTLANLLEEPLKYMKTDFKRNVTKYVYMYNKDRGFSNSVIPRPVPSESIQETGAGLLVEVEGELTHQYAAAYYELDTSMLGTSCRTASLSISGSPGLNAYLVQLRAGSRGYSTPRLSILSTSTGVQTSARLCASSAQQTWLVVYAASSPTVSYDLRLTISP